MNMTRLTEEGYSKYPQFLNRKIDIISEDENRYRIKIKGKGEKWISKDLITGDQVKEEVVDDSEPDI
jgi:hypothetical protein